MIDSSAPSPPDPPEPTEPPDQPEPPEPPPPDLDPIIRSAAPPSNNTGIIDFLAMTDCTTPDSALVL